MTLNWNLDFEIQQCLGSPKHVINTTIRIRDTECYNISIYTLEELERLESLRVWEFIHTHAYDVNLLKKGEMDVDLSTLFRAIG
jgi:hypothetical protein